MKDEYISVEHVFLGILQRPCNAASEIFKTFGITTEKFMQTLSTVRGNQRVTSDNPEDTYNALKKYGQDLVEMARANKLDPVIGRDSEIRNVIRILSRKRKNNPSSSVRPVSVRPPSPRALPSVSCVAMCPRT